MQRPDSPSCPPYRPGFGLTLAAFIIYPWVSTLLKRWNYVTYRTPGLFIGIGLFLAIILVVLLIDYLMARLGLEGALRSALWFSALLGSYAGLVALNE